MLLNLKLTLTKKHQMKALTFTLALLFSFTVKAGPFQVFTTKQGLLNNNVNCIEQGDNFVWIGTNSGINRVITTNNKITSFSPRGTSVPVLSLKNDGAFIWVGLKGKGVYKMPKANYKFIGFRKDVLGDKSILNIEKEANILIVTTPQTVYSFDLNSAEYTSKPNVAKSFNKTIKVGDKVITNYKNQISRYNPTTQSYRAFNYKAKINQYISWNKDVLIASNNGLLLYKPNNDDIKFQKPTLELVAFKVNGLDTNQVLDAALPWDNYIFTYEFAFIELGEKEDITLHYTVQHNSEAPTELFVNAAKPLMLKELSFGDYTIEVTAKNKLGVVASNSLTYSFSIQNPMNDTILLVLFWSVCIVIFTVVVILLTRAKFKKDIRLLEDALLKKTNELNSIKNKNYRLVDEDEATIN